jgi:hypothetical protein
MTQLLERERARVAPPPALKPPISRKPWIPLLWGVGLLLAVVAVGFAVANLLIGDEVEYYDRAVEHGDHTAFVQDLRTDLSPGYVGQDANLDPDVVGPIPPIELTTGMEVNPADLKFFANVPEPTIDPADQKFFANTPEPKIDPADRKFFGG